MIRAKYLGSILGFPSFGKQALLRAIDNPWISFIS